MIKKKEKKTGVLRTGDSSCRNENEEDKKATFRLLC